MLEFGLGFGDFGLHVNEVAQGHGIFCGAYHEGAGPFALGGHHLYGIHACHLANDGVHGGNGVGAHHLQVEHFARRDVLAIAHGAHIGHHTGGLRHGGEQFGIAFLRSGNLLRAHHDALALFAVGQVLPQLFRDEGHEGVEQVEQMVEGLEHGGIGLRINGLAIGGLHEFKQPGREVVPEEVIDLHQGFAQAIFRVEVGHLSGTVAQAGFKPLDSERGGFALGGFGAHLPTLD